MRRVVVSIDSDDRLREALALISQGPGGYQYPLGHVAAVKKSQIHHALADMMNQVGRWVVGGWEGVCLLMDR